MHYQVIDAKHIAGFVIWLKFSDNSEGEIDLQAEIYGSVFEPLKEPAFFRQFSVDPELHTLTWPNGADFAPEFLYELVHKTLAA